jgi:hypothetical protein
VLDGSPVGRQAFYIHAVALNGIEDLEMKDSMGRMLTLFQVEEAFSDF